jgi:hypothetical protein
MVKLTPTEIPCAMTSMTIQNYSIEELLTVVQKFRNTEKQLKYAETEIIKMFQDNCKNCHKVISEFLQEKINQDNTVQLDFGMYQMEIYSNKQRLELVKESMEDIILLLEQILSERGA